MSKQNMKMEELSALVKAKRGKIGLRETAKQVEVSPSTLSRVEQGKIPDLETLQKLCDWLQVPLSRFMNETEHDDSNVIAGLNLQGMDTPSIISAHLRADKALSPESAEALSRMIQVAYETFAKKPGKDEVQ